MARWKLTESHYLMIDGTTWEYTEIDRTTGRPKRTKFPVPMLLDPASPDDLKVNGQMDPFLGVDGDPVIIVISNEDSRKNSKDLIFKGDPTPGMFPLDDEAKALTKKFSEGKWDPTRGIDPGSQAESYANKMMNGLIEQMTDLKNNGPPPAHGMEEFMKTMGAMMSQQTEILSKLASNTAVRR